METKNILSIDFDYIMYPCIKLYNHLSLGGESSKIIWDIIEHELEVDKFLCYDANTYKNIVKLVKKFTDSGAKLIPIEEHDQIIPNLQTDIYQYNVINIDFHHDIFYRKEELTTAKNFKKYTCADWLGYLLINNYIDNAYWIKAPNSDPYDLNLKDFGNHLQICSSFELEDTINKVDHIDTIFLCLSPQWIPYKFKHLYDLIVELFGEDK